MPGTTTAKASFMKSSEVLTQLAAATTIFFVSLSMAMTDHVANAEPSKEKRTARNRIDFFTIIFIGVHTPVPRIAFTAGQMDSAYCLRCRSTHSWFADIRV